MFIHRIITDGIWLWMIYGLSKIVISNHLFRTNDS